MHAMKQNFFSGCEQLLKTGFWHEGEAAPNRKEKMIVLAAPRVTVGIAVLEVTYNGLTERKRKGFSPPTDGR